jgi:hypothetical protein
MRSWSLDGSEEDQADFLLRHGAHRRTPNYSDNNEQTKSVHGKNDHGELTG